MDTAKQAYQIISNVTDLLTEKADIARFESVKKSYNDAAGMINEDEQAIAAIKAWTVSMANNAVFLAWRRNILTPEIEKAYRELPSTETALEDYETFKKQFDDEAKKIEDERRAFMDKQHKLDVFNAVLNGIDKETAEAKYKEYQEKIAQSMGA